MKSDDFDHPIGEWIGKKLLDEIGTARGTLIDIALVGKLGSRTTAPGACFDGWVGSTVGRVARIGGGGDC